MGVAVPYRSAGGRGLQSSDRTPAASGTRSSSGGSGHRDSEPLSGLHRLTEIGAIDLRSGFQGLDTLISAVRGFDDERDVGLPAQPKDLADRLRNGEMSPALVGIDLIGDRENLV